ncbi:MAG: insulinase family protein [Holophagales bacterium]|nr:insulinase family protein [Holophagales bacterium]
MSRLLGPLAATLVLAVTIAAAVPAPAQDVPVVKYQLPNGMTVMLLEDHSLPIAVVNIWYRVGSKDEPPRRSGFAHLFEHLMFMGTERVPNGDFDRLMEAAGGANNASTSNDRTNYYSWGPASLLPTLLWLDADRLEDLAKTMDQKKVDLQRDVVLNELKQSYENRPYGRANLEIQYLLYPIDHPYHFSTIGTEEDLKAASATDVKDFFATYYTPGNASLVVAGDFDPAVIRPLVDRLFGTLPKGTAPNRRPVPSAKLDGVKRGVMYDRVQLPQVSFAYHAPKAYGPGDAETDLLAALLTDGKSSPLSKRLVIDDKLAASVTAENDSNLLGSIFRIDVQVRADADLDKVEKAVDEELARFLKDGPTAEELEQRKAPVELAKVASLQRLERRADALNAYEFYWGEPNSFRRDLDRYRNATPATVLSNARQVVTQDARVIYRVLPEQPSRGASARDTRPADGAPAAFKPPAPERFTLSNGIPVQLWKTSDLPLVSVSAVFQPGGPLDSSSATAGLASLTTNMLDEGAGALDAIGFGEAVATLGGRFNANASREAVVANLTILSRNFGKGAGLLADAVRRPRLEAKDFDRVQRLTLDELTQSTNQPAVVAGRVAAVALFGSAHPYAWPMTGTPETVKGTSLDQVRAAHAALLRPDTLTLLVAGNLSAAEAKAALEKSFGDWKAGGPKPARPAAPATFAPSPAGPGLRVVVVDRPDAPQTVVRFAAPAPRFDDPSRVGLRLLGTLLGGSFTSRLNQNLREAHGYTYGARASFSPGPVLGTFGSGADVKAAVTGASVKEFLSEFARFSKGDVTDEEAGKARETVKNEIVQTFSGTSGVLATATSFLENGASFETLGKDLGTMAKETAASLNAIAKSAVALDRGVLVLVGDRKSIVPQLQGLGLAAPLEVDAWGAKVPAK